MCLICVFFLFTGDPDPPPVHDKPHDSNKTTANQTHAVNVTTKVPSDSNITSANQTFPNATNITTLAPSIELEKTTVSNKSSPINAATPSYLGFNNTVASNNTVFSNNTVLTNQTQSKHIYKTVETTAKPIIITPTTVNSNSTVT